MSDKSKTKRAANATSVAREGAKRPDASNRGTRVSKETVPGPDARTKATAVAARDVAATNGADGERTQRATKKGQLVALLSTKAGADVATLSTALGWQMHTTRAALTGLRRAGHTLEASRAAGRTSSIYRIVPGTGPSRGAA